MKKFGILLLTALMVFAYTTQAQDANAKKILEAMTSKYKSISAFKANFAVEMHNPANDSKDTYKGEITVQGDKYHLDMAEQEIYNNLTFVWTCLKEDGEVFEISKVEYEPDPEAMMSSITDVYTTWQKGFKYVMKENSNSYDVIQLNPEDLSLEYHSIILKIKKDHTLHSWEIFEKSGRKYTYIIQSFDDKIQVTDADFECNPDDYPDAELNDLTDF